MSSVVATRRCPRLATRHNLLQHLLALLPLPPSCEKRLRTAPIDPRTIRAASTRLSQTESTVRIPSIADETLTYQTFISASGSLGQGAGDGVGHETAAQSQDRTAPQNRSAVEESIGDETGHDGHQVQWGGSAGIRALR